MELKQQTGRKTMCLQILLCKKRVKVTEQERSLHGVAPGRQWEAGSDQARRTGRNPAKGFMVLTNNEATVLKNTRQPHFELPVSQLAPHKPTHPVDLVSTPSSCRAKNGSERTGRPVMCTDIPDRLSLGLPYPCSFPVIP